MSAKPETWTIKVGVKPPSTGDRPMHKWTRDELEQAREYWHRRIEATTNHPTMPATIQAAEIRFCHHWLQKTMGVIRNQELGPC